MGHRKGSGVLVDAHRRAAVGADEGRPVQEQALQRTKAVAGALRNVRQPGQQAPVGMAGEDDNAFEAARPKLGRQAPDAGQATVPGPTLLAAARPVVVVDHFADPIDTAEQLAGEGGRRGDHGHLAAAALRRHPLKVRHVPDEVANARVLVQHHGEGASVQGQGQGRSRVSAGGRGGVGRADRAGHHHGLSSRSKRADSASTRSSSHTRMQSKRPPHVGWRWQGEQSRGSYSTQVRASPVCR